MKEASKQEYLANKNPFIIHSTIPFHTDRSLTACDTADILAFIFEIDF